MPSRGQSIVLTYVAWDTSANVGKSGDVSNHTLRWIKDGTSSAPTNAASEIDATNAPGAYKLTLTTAECTCDTGTLVGKSSTANVSIIPVSIAFEQLPTVAAGATNGLPLVDSSGRVKSNLEAIDGLATNGNNATLKLKSLDIRSNSSEVYPLDIRGFMGTAGNYDGGRAVNIAGGNAYGSSGNGSGGDGIRIVGGTLQGSGTRGYALRIIASGTGGGGGIYATGDYGQVPLLLKGDSYTPGMRVTGGYEWIGGIEANIKGDLVGSISKIRPKKNTGLANFMFPMFDATTKNPKAGLTVTAERAIDGNPFASCSNGVVELSNGVYRVSLSADDLNGDKIMLRFSATGADDQLIEIITQD